MRRLGHERFAAGRRRLGRDRHRRARRPPRRAPPRRLPDDAGLPGDQHARAAPGGVRPRRGVDAGAARGVADHAQPLDRPQHRSADARLRAVDSPVGTAAWLWERRAAWSDGGIGVFDRDFLCTTASIYWLTRHDRHVAADLPRALQPPLGARAHRGADRRRGLPEGARPDPARARRGTHEPQALDRDGARRATSPPPARPDRQRGGVAASEAPFGERVFVAHLASSTTMKLSNECLF